MRIFRVRYIERQGNMWVGSNEKSHRRKSCSLPNLILVPHLGENWHIARTNTRKSRLLWVRFASKVSRWPENRGSKRNQFLKIWYPNSQKNLEQISASFANPQDKSLALWELKRPMLFRVQFRHILKPVFTSQCKQLKTDFKDANITQGLENHNHIPPNTASCFCSSWAEIPGFSMLIDALYSSRTCTWKFETG